MRTFSFNTISSEYAARLLKTMQDNYGYIVFFNKGNAPEAFQQIFLTAMRSENRSYSDLAPYVKKLARTVLRTHSREIPCSPYNEEGEVAFSFIDLVEEPDPLEFEHRNHIDEALQELYLRFPDDFVQLKLMIPCTDPKDIQGIIRNKQLKAKIFELISDYNARLVFTGIVKFLGVLEKEKAKASAADSGKVISMHLPDYRYAQTLTDRKWICDKNGKAYGIDPTTLAMEDDFNVELTKFRLAVPTSCAIWKMDCTEYYEDIENKIYAEQGVDNEYIHWCGNKYKLTTPSGAEYLNIDRAKFMDYVRQELVLTLLASGIGTLIAVSPDNLYIRLTKAASTSMLRVKTDSGKIFKFPMSIQEAQVMKINA